MPNRRVDIAGFVSKVRGAAADVIGDQVAESADGIRESLSIDAPPGSKPGEPPRRRTGGLQAGIETAMTDDGTAVTGSIGSGRADGDERVPAWLEFGTQKMAPRPYMQPAKDAAVAPARKRLTSALAAVKP